MADTNLIIASSTVATALFAGAAWWSTHVLARIERGRFLLEMMRQALDLANSAIDAATNAGLEAMASGVMAQVVHLSKMNANPQGFVERRRHRKAVRQLIYDLNRTATETHQAVLRHALSQPSK